MNIKKSVDVIYPLHNRLYYTQFTFPVILQECLNSAAFNKLWVYDDNSTDGSGLFVQNLIDMNRDVLNVEYTKKKIGNSVDQINDTYPKTDSRFLVKVDNDILVPYGYIDHMAVLIEENEDIGFLMMEETQGWPYIDSWDFFHRPSDHIGGVGIFRKIIFDTLGPIKTEKRFFGFTRYQQKACKKMKFICAEADAGNTNLDLSPLSRAWEYEEKGYSRILNRNVKSVFKEKAELQEIA